MTKPNRVSACKAFAPWLSAHIDGELDAVHCSELDAHLGCCVQCREELALLRALRGSLKRRASARAPQALRERVLSALAESSDRAAGEQPAAVAQVAVVAPGSRPSLEPGPQNESRPQLIRMRFAVPLAAAAIFALVFAAIRSRTPSGEVAEAVATAVPASEQALETLLDDLVTQHADPLPPETTDPNGLERFNPLVGVRLKRPEFQPYGARYVGARLQALRERRAAMLQFVMDGQRRVTMYIFNPRRVPVFAAETQPHYLHQRAVDARRVYVGHMRGFAVAASENDGIGYALAGDISDDESAQLVVAASRSAR